MDSCMERGVFREPYLDPSGNEILVAVDRYGRAVARATVRREGSRDAVVARLQEILWEEDPKANLTFLH